MRWKLVLSGVLGLGLALPACADPGEEFPEGPRAEDGEVLPAGDEESMEPVDVLRTLEEVLMRMKNAEASLADAGNAKAISDEGRAIDDLAKLLASGNLEQAAAIQNLESLIEAARDSESSATADSKGSRKDGGRQGPPDGARSQNSGNPAKTGYTGTGSDEGFPRVDRDGELNARWGNLPVRLREELSQADDDFRSVKGSYREKLFEYSKFMSQE